MGQPRWDSDERGTGVADARAQSPTIDALRGLLDAPDWVAEEPEVHLLPHLERVVAAQTGWAIESARTDDDGTFTVDLRWTRPESLTLRATRAAAFTMIGSVAESITTIHQRVIEDGVAFEVVTGMLPGDTDLATHGHTLRLRLHGTGGGHGAGDETGSV